MASVPSVEPESTTTISDSPSRLDRHLPMQASSFLQMTVAEIGRAVRAGSISADHAFEAVGSGGPSRRGMTRAGRRGRRPLAPCRGRNIRSFPERPVLSAPKAFIIHLERATGRRASVEALRARLPIESEVLPAVDGRLLAAGSGRGGLCPGAIFAALSFCAGPGGDRRLPEPSRRLAADRRRRPRLRFGVRGRRRDRPGAVRRAPRFRNGRARPLDLRASAGGGAGAAGRRRRAAGEFRLAEASCAAAAGDRADRLARRGRAAARDHRALRPAGRHLSADGLGDRRNAPGRDADPHPRRVARDRRDHGPARRTGPPPTSASRGACGRFTGRKCWRSTAGISHSQERREGAGAREGPKLNGAEPPAALHGAGAGGDRRRSGRRPPSRLRRLSAATTAPRYRGSDGLKSFDCCPRRVGLRRVEAQAPAPGGEVDCALQIRGDPRGEEIAIDDMRHAFAERELQR